jgi:hypothetical protein
VLLEAVATRNALLSKTRWAETSGPESEFAKRLSLAPALYGSLGRRIGRDQASQAMHEIIVSVGWSEQWDHLNSMHLTEATGMERLVAFNKLMDREGAPRYNKREYVRQDDSICHFRITRCIFSDFFTEAGTPELTRSFCEVDRRFFPEAFPDFRFDRGDSWENTIAHGKSHCEFVFEKRGIQLGN